MFTMRRKVYVWKQKIGNYLSVNAILKSGIAIIVAYVYHAKNII